MFGAAQDVFLAQFVDEGRTEPGDLAGLSGENPLRHDRVRVIQVENRGKIEVQTQSLELGSNDPGTATQVDRTPFRQLAHRRNWIEYVFQPVNASPFMVDSQ